MANNDFQTALANGFAANVSPARPIGCCRVYVSFPRLVRKDIAKAAKALGRIYQTKAHYNFVDALYVGYDNCSGRELAQADAIKAEFAKLGVLTFVEYAGD